MKKPEDIYFLVGCERSQAICIALRKLGVQAFSCDLEPCTGSHPEWHIQGDVFQAIHAPDLMLQNGSRTYIPNWDAAVFHPECTYLTVSGLHWNKRVPGRAEKTEEALQFVCDLLNCGIPYIKLENPIGCISTRITYAMGSYQVVPERNLLKWKGVKPSEIIQPYQFGDDASKATCFWNIGFPNLKIDPANYYPPRITADGKKRWSNQTDSGQNKLMIDGKWIGYNDPRTKTYRSKTYPGIAKELAKQSVDFLMNSL